MSSYDFNKLPDINFAEKDTEKIAAEIISYVEGEAGRNVQSVYPLRMLLLAFAKYAALLRSLIDYAGKQNLLRYAGEGFLQNLAALVGVEILEPAKASATIKFSLSVQLAQTALIPKGTRVTPGNKIYFATIEDLEIPPGEISAEVEAECTAAGIIGNGYYPGQINQLSDPFPYTLSVENTTLSKGGADREGLEPFRERIRIAPESYSVAGPYGAYIYWAKTASQLISDVSVSSPNPGEVLIVPLLSNGEIPSADLLNKVYEKCSDDTKRPFTDKVIVNAPEEVFYDISFVYYISRKDSSTGLAIQSRVDEAVENYILWQGSALGRDLNPSKLISLLMDAGVKRVEMAKPVYTRLNKNQVAVCQSKNPIYGGLEDD